MKEELLNYVLNQLSQTESGLPVSINSLTEGFKDKVDKETKLWLLDILPAEARKKGIYLIPETDCDINKPLNNVLVVNRKPANRTTKKKDCVSIKYVAGGYMIEKPAVEVEIRRSDVEPAEWDRITAEVFGKCKVLNWYNKYNAWTIMDGYYWKLELGFINGVTLNYSGSNDEPEGLTRLENAICEWEEVLIDD